MQLLRAIHDALFPPRATELLVRTASLAQLAGVLESTCVEDTEIAALLPYRNPLVQALVVEAKFHRNQHAQQLLGQLLADYLTESLADDELFEARNVVVVPLPLSDTRRKMRGYNQAEDIARIAAEQIPQRVSFLPHALTRIRDTVPQTSLGREARLRNMHDAFDARAGLDPDCLYIVIDDVATTGATLTAAMAALHACGIEHVRATALAN